MKEVWKAVPDFEGYEVSNFGQVRSFYKRIKDTWILSDSPQRVLSQALRSNHLFVCLRKNGKNYARQVHTLVALAFIGPRPKKQQVCHGDCNSLNNRLDNLRYDTPSGNAFDTIRITGYKNRLSQNDALQMRLDSKNGSSTSELIDKYKIAKSTVYLILTHRTFKEIGGPNFSGRILPLQDINKIKELHDSGMSLSKLGKMYNKHPSSISRIVNNITYKNSQS